MVLVLVSGLGGIEIHAEDRVYDFKMQYMQFTASDDMVVITKSTSDSSEDWAKLGIKNVENAKKDFESRNVVAAIGSISTKQLVYFHYKQDNNTLDVFDTMKWDDEKLKEYSLSQVQQNNVEAECDIFRHEQGKFFKLNMRYEENEELMIGTFFNAILVEFSMNNEAGGYGINEEFLEDVVSRVHFTRIMTREEYDAEVKKTWTIIFCVLGGIVLLFAGLIIGNRIKKKKDKEKATNISNKMSEFRDARKSGAIEPGEPVLEVETVYDSKLIAEFVRYNTWLKNIVRYIISVCLYALIVWYAAGRGNTVLALFTIAVGVVVLYMMYSAGEKKRDALSRQFVVSAKKTAVFKFYEEFMTMSGIASLTEFIYPQITEYKLHNGYLYLYMSDEYALMIDLEGMEEIKVAGLLGILKEKTKV